MAGVYANLGLAITKSGAGYLAGSMALMADGLHSLSDLASDAVTLGVLRLTNRPPNSKYPFGYGRFDALGTLCVASLLVGGSCTIGFHALESLVATAADPLLVTGSEELPASALEFAAPAMVVAGASIGVKEVLYRKTRAVGEKARSSVVVANAWHHRSDALSSIVALGGLVGAANGMPVLDVVGGVVVSGMILKVGCEMGWDAIQELSDASVQQDVVDKIRILGRQLKADQEDIFGLHNIRARRMGHYTIVDLHLEVDPQLSISMAYAAAARLKKRIKLEMPEVIDVSTHLEPFNPKEHARVHPVDQLRRGRGRSRDGSLHPHHHWFSDDGLHTGAKSKKSQAQLAAKLQDVIASLPFQVEVTHLTCHYLEDRLTAEITMEWQDGSLSIARARELAQEARREIIARVDDVDEVDLHLEM